MVETSNTQSAAAARMALALDVDDLVVASRLARELRPCFAVAKIGLELYTAAGPEAIGTMLDLGYEVFLDVKLHDIPNTVAGAARVAGALGVRYLTLHAQGGVAMLQAGADGFLTGAANASLRSPVPLAVTVLTSDRDAPEHILHKRVGLAMEAGCAGLVCAAVDLADIRTYAPRMVTVVPGIRPAGSPAHDQARPATPGDAIAAGADLIVVGRSVTDATDRRAAADAVLEEVAGALAVKVRD